MKKVISYTKFLEFCVENPKLSKKIRVGCKAYFITTSRFLGGDRLELSLIESSNPTPLGTLKKIYSEA
jgi:hypothetical protein